MSQKHYHDTYMYIPQFLCSLLSPPCVWIQDMFAINACFYQFKLNIYADTHLICSTEIVRFIGHLAKGQPKNYCILTYNEFKLGYGHCFCT